MLMSCVLSGGIERASDITVPASLAVPFVCWNSAFQFSLAEICQSVSQSVGHFLSVFESEFQLAGMLCKRAEALARVETVTFNDGKHKLREVSGWVGVWSMRRCKYGVEETIIKATHPVVEWVGKGL